MWGNGVSWSMVTTDCTVPLRWIASTYSHSWEGGRVHREERVGRRKGEGEKEGDKEEGKRGRKGGREEGTDGWREGTEREER